MASSGLCSPGNIKNRNENRQCRATLTDEVMMKIKNENGSCEKQFGFQAPLNNQRLSTGHHDPSSSRSLHKTFHQHNLQLFHIEAKNLTRKFKSHNPQRVCTTDGENL